MSLPARGAVWRFLGILCACLALFLGRGLLSGGYFDSASLLLGHFPWRSELPMPARHEMNSMLTDQPTQFLLWHRYSAEQIRQGRLPLWNPWSGAGRPFLANSQSAVFSPANLGHYLFNERVGLLWAAAWRYLCAGLGMWVLARRLGLGEAAARFAGVAFAFSGPFVVWLGHPHSAVFATLPWLMAAAHALVHAPGPLPAAGLGAAVALAFVGGHPESTFHVVVSATVWGAWLLVRVGTRRRATCGWTCAGIALGLLLAAAHWVPFVEYLANSDAWAVRSGEAIDKIPPVPPPAVVAWWLPDVFGHPQGEPFWFEGISYSSLSAYAGLMVPLMAGFGLRREGRTSDVLALAVLGLVALLGVYGVPPIIWLLDWLPLFRSARNNRLLVVGVLAVCVLAARGWEGLWARTDLRGRWLIAAGLGAVILGAGLLLTILFGPESPTIAKALVRAGAALAGTGAVMALGLRHWGVLAVLAADLLSWGYRFNPVTPPEHHYPTTPFIATLQRELAGQSQRRLLARGYLFPSETPMKYGIQDIKCWDAVEPLRYGRYLDLARETGRGAADRPRPTIRLALYRTYRSRLLDALGEWVILSAEPLSDPGLTPLAKVPGVYAYRNAQALPRARLAERVEVLPTADAVAERLQQRDHDPAALTVLEGPPFPHEAAGRGAVEFLVEEPSRVRLRVTADAPAALVLADVMFPGWEATVDGAPTTIWIADLAFRAVPVPAGEHVVEFIYRPRSVRAGLGLSAAGAVLTALCLLVPRKRAIGAANSRGL